MKAYTKYGFFCDVILEIWLVFLGQICKFIYE